MMPLDPIIIDSRKICRDMMKNWETIIAKGMTDTQEFIKGNKYWRKENVENFADYNKR